MRNLWLQFGCFLTGYNYTILAKSSEVSAKAVKRYTAALIIISILWAFIGYSFANRYLGASLYGSIAAAFIFVIIVIQIERQIILSINPSWVLYVARGFIAIVMSLIGAIIIDQLIFKEDIELEKVNYINQRVEQAMGPRAALLKQHLAELDSAIQTKEKERTQLAEDLAAKPTIAAAEMAMGMEQTTVYNRDSLGRSIPTVQSRPRTLTVVKQVPNPKLTLLPALDSTITALRREKTTLDAQLIQLRPQLEKEISARIGFLDELEIMFVILKKSTPAFVVWLLWLLFLLGIELLVLISKSIEKANDYEKMVQHHMDVQMQQLELFAKYRKSPSGEPQPKQE